MELEKAELNAEKDTQPPAPSYPNIEKPPPQRTTVPAIMA